MKVRRLFSSLLFFFCSFAGLSQPCSLENDSIQALVDQVLRLPPANQVYKDDISPFFKWKEKPKSVSIKVFDRWGTVIAVYDSADFFWDSVGCCGRDCEGKLFYFFVELTTQDLRKLSFCGKTLCLGYSRCG